MMKRELTSKTMLITRVLYYRASLSSIVSGPVKNRMTPAYTQATLITKIRKRRRFMKLKLCKPRILQTV